MKRNRCDVLLLCREYKKNCVYFKRTKEHCHCHYYDCEGSNGACESLVAQTNAMVIALQAMGFDVTLKAKEKAA